MKSSLIKLLALFCFFSINAQQWQAVNSGTSEALYDIHFVSGQKGYAIGGGDIFGYPQQNGQGVILKTTDGGNTWSTVFSQGNTSIYEIVEINNELIAFGKFSGNQYKFTTSDNGNTWQSTQLSFSVRNVKASGNIIFFKDDFSTTLEKIENGAVSTVAQNVGRYGVNDNELIYVNGYYNTIYKSIDYGNTFNPLNGYPTGFGQDQSTQAVMKSFGDTLLVHYTYPSATEYSIDNGKTWTIEYGGGNYCEIISNNLLVGCGYNKITVQFDLGSWQYLVALGNDLSNKIRKVYFYHENLGFAVGDNGMIYRTTNGGGLFGVIENKVSQIPVGIYPNPADDTINIKNEGYYSIKKICLTDINGKIVGEYPGNTRQLDIGHLAAGNYFLQVYTTQGKTTKKILVE